MLLGNVLSNGFKLLVHPLDIIQEVPPSQLLTNILDPSLEKDHRCVYDFYGSSLLMKSSCLLYLVEDMILNSKGKVLLGTILIDDYTAIKKVVSHS